MLPFLPMAESPDLPYVNALAITSEAMAKGWSIDRRAGPVARSDRATFMPQAHILTG